jgi:cation diffusion facilitator CzcD-associated flavoprotein CzcO
MTAATAQKQSRTSPAQHFDVLIVGAGISGVGAAYHLAKQTPGTSFVVLETLDSFGGTWITHKYPGIRSDSDLHTFGYRFKPWVGPPIASAEEILAYMHEVIEENDLGRHIRYGHRIIRADWSNADNLWTIEAEKKETGETVRFTAGFLWMCQGYYRHSKGYTPEWPGMADFKGQIIHPQTWPEDLDYKGKKVVVVGSGATAATLVPAIANECAHVTMLQRSPTYFIPGRNAIDIAEQLRALQVDETWIHEITRRQILKTQDEFTQRSRAEPEAVKAELLAGVRMFLGPDYDVETHFTPTYRPWRQRIAFVPDGDLFRGIASGKASVVTDEIDRFTEGGIRLKSGKTLEADIIITATGFDLNVLGDIEFHIDGKPLVFSDTVTYRGMMFTGVPNLVWVFGYFRASWTLRVDLVADFVCRLLKHMKKRGAKRIEVAIPPGLKNMKLQSWIDTEDFNPGYLLRGMHLLPKRGEGREWQHTQDYWHEKDELPKIDLDGEQFVYDTQKVPA